MVTLFNAYSDPVTLKVEGDSITLPPRRATKVDGKFAACANGHIRLIGGVTTPAAAAATLTPNGLPAPTTPVVPVETQPAAISVKGSPSSHRNHR